MWKIFLSPLHVHVVRGDPPTEQITQLRANYSY